MLTLWALLAGASSGNLGCQGCEQKAPAPVLASSIELPSGAAIEARIDVANPKRVDVLDVYPQAKAFALRVEPSAGLVQIRITNVRRGTVDLTEGGRFQFEFEVDGVIAGKPPGQDRVSRTVMVKVEDLTLTATRREGATLLQRTGSLPDPGCSVEKAWTTAVRAGVPDDAVATMHYYRFRREDPPVWNVRVDGHDELSRLIDGRDGTLVTH